ncbi:hypothetical protein [Verrucomicrobium spinosum]|uniref:hypothetical protein n=1 Tax=Verrucomicrobium spinosum TaxID=2736 RepID=UPI00210AE58F|nr:hypothetical protein [Verrucomicrobium spinosum]
MSDAASFYTSSSTHQSSEPPKGHTYKQAGVDIREAAALVGDIGQLVKRTQKRRQLAGAFGLFAAAYDLSAYKHPVIVTGCDASAPSWNFSSNTTCWRMRARTSSP